MTTPTPELAVTAFTPGEMVSAQTNLIAWCGQKIQTLKVDLFELKESVAMAVKNRWRASTLKKHERVTERRITYYEKIKAALEAGYCIVPNFPVHVFAIRTGKDRPAKMLKITEQSYAPGHLLTQSAEVLPAGDGSYVNPQPIVETTSSKMETPTKNYAGVQNKIWSEQATDWDTEIDFPINMAKPMIMEATKAAMEALVFDELGILPDPHPKKDPLIVGRIYAPKRHPYDNGFVTFIIAWHLNVRDL